MEVHHLQKQMQLEIITLRVRLSYSKAALGHGLGRSTSQLQTTHCLYNVRTLTRRGCVLLTPKKHGQGRYCQTPEKPSDPNTPVPLTHRTWCYHARSKGFLRSQVSPAARDGKVTWGDRPGPCRHQQAGWLVNHRNTSPKSKFLDVGRFPSHFLVHRWGFLTISSCGGREGLSQGLPPIRAPIPF